MLDSTPVSRRTLLVGVVTGASGMGGCLSFGDGQTREGGEVVVRNESGGDRTIEVTTSKIHEDEREPNADPDDLTPPTTQLLHRNETFRVPDGETRSSTELIPEPGTYHIYASDDRDGERAVEYGFYPAGTDGESPGGGSVYVSVEGSDSEPNIRISVFESD